MCCISVYVCYNVYRYAYKISFIFLSRWRSKMTEFRFAVWTESNLHRWTDKIRARVRTSKKSARCVAPRRAQVLVGLLIKSRLLPVHWLITKPLSTCIAYLYCRTAAQSLWFRARNAMLVAILTHDGFIYIVTFDDDKTIEQKKKLRKMLYYRKFALTFIELCVEAF